MPAKFNKPRTASVMLTELESPGSCKTSGGAIRKRLDRSAGQSRRLFLEHNRGETIQPTAIMSKDTSKLAKELEGVLNRNAVPAQGNPSRIGIKIESSDVTIRQPIRIQQPMIQRYQYYTGDA